MTDNNINRTGELSSQEDQMKINSLITSKEDLKKLSNDELVSLLIEFNFSLSAIDKKFGFHKDFSRRLYRKRNIDYNKILIENKQLEMEKYYKNPNKCQHCGKELDWEHRNNKYCSSSCAASENNKGIVRNPNGNPKTLQHPSKSLSNKTKRKTSQKKDNPKLEKFNNYCLNCGKEITNGRKNFCSEECRKDYKHKLLYKDFIENNDKYCRGNYTPKSFKNDILKEQGNVCDICGCKPEWNGKPLTFILDHIDGDAANNKRENLRMICPNCDTQLPTFKSKNKNSSRRNYWKDKIRKDLLNELNINNDDDNTL